MIEKVLIVDDNSEFVVSLCKYIQNEITYIKTIGIASDGQEALKYIEKIKPNIIILDLQMPKLNGIEFLKRLNDKEIKVILISGDIQLINELFIQDFCNIKKIYIKPFKFYKLKEDFRRLIENTDTWNDEKIMQMINEELEKFNFNKSSIGYKYLIQCIIEVYKNQKRLNNIEKDLLPCVAEKLNVKDSKTIKWTLRKMIISMVRYTDTKTIQQYFPYTKNPTTKMFLTMINEHINQKMIL